MLSAVRQKPPAWFWVVGVVLLLWGAMGCYTCIQQFRLGSDAWGDPANADYNRALYASLPWWYNWVYAVSVGAALLGAIALLGRSATARTLFIVSIIGVVVQFGYAFIATDMIAHKGAAATVPFPIVVFLIVAASIWFAGYAARRGWIG